MIAFGEGIDQSSTLSANKTFLNFINKPLRDDFSLQFLFAPTTLIFNLHRENIKFGLIGIVVTNIVCLYLIQFTLSATLLMIANNYFSWSREQIFFKLTVKIDI